MWTIRQKWDIGDLNMLLFGHMGITLAAGMLVKGALVKQPAPEAEDGEIEASSHLNTKKDSSSGSRISSLTLIKNHMDYRVLLIGSLLPDLIDKPLGDIFFYGAFQNGRIIAHTLVFNILLTALAIYALKKWKSVWPLILAFGSVLHLILDQIWLEYYTFLWPLYGWSFPKVDTVDFFGWLPTMLYNLTTIVAIYVPEIIGFSILIWFAVRLIQKKQVYAFIRSGITT